MDGTCECLWERNVLNSISFTHYFRNSQTHIHTHRHTYTHIPHIIRTLPHLPYTSWIFTVGVTRLPQQRPRDRCGDPVCVCVCACVGVFVCVYEVRSVAVLSNGRECSPPPHLIESAGLRPRLFQPQLIECICTRLHNDRWVSPQLAFFFYMFSKNDKAGLCFLTPLSVVLFLSLCLSCSPFFPKIGVKKNLWMSVSSRGMLLFHSGGEGGGEGGFTWLMLRSLSSTFSCSPATSFSGAQSDYTRQQQSECSCVSLCILSKALPPRAVRPFCFIFWSVNQPNI